MSLRADHRRGRVTGAGTRIADVDVMLRSAVRSSFVIALLAATGIAAASCRDTGTNTDTRPPSEGTATPGAGAEGGGKHGDPRTVPGKPDEGGVPGTTGGANITRDGGAAPAAAPSAPAPVVDGGVAPETETQR
jgi:hypothetical protein